MTTGTATKPLKRPYLGKAERKKQLIDAACEMVETSGWFSLNMSTLADQAGVSRQLVYQHFPNLEDLLTQTCHAIFDDTMTGTAQAITDHPDDIKKAIEAAAVVAMPCGK